MLKPIHTTLMYFPERTMIAVGVMLIANIVITLLLKSAISRNKKTVCSAMRALVFFNYCFGLLFFTVLGRHSLAYYHYDFRTGYSYELAFCSGDVEMLEEIAANIVVFIPIGFYHHFIGKKTVIKALLTGLMISLNIELLQLVLKKGLCELDDLLSYTIGTAVGCLIAELLRT